MKLFHFILILFLPCFLMAQNKPIKNTWEEIDLAFSRGQFTSLLPEIQEVKNTALKEKNDADYIKALFYEAKIKIATTDNTDDVNFVFETFSKEINGKSKVRDAVVTFYLAKLYQIYYYENQYKIDGRTELENQTSNDVRFWTKDGFDKKDADLFKKIIASKDELLKENIDNWKKLFVTNYTNEKNFEANKSLTPTLYDVMIDDYSNHDDFDLKLLKELAVININTANYDAYLYNQNKILNTENKGNINEKFLAEKENLAAQYFDKSWYALKIYDEIVQNLMSKNDSEKIDFKKVFAIENKLKAKDINSPYTLKVITSANIIRSKSYDIKLDNYVIPNENIAVNVTHKNTSKLFVRVLDFTQKFGNDRFNNFSTYDTVQLKRTEKLIKNLKISQEYSIDLKAFDDFQNHSTIAKLNPLTTGNYIILISSNPKFDLFSQEEPVIYNMISATNYAINIVDNEFHIVDRKTGKPQAKTSLEVYRNNKTEVVTSNENGVVSTNFNNTQVEYRVKNDPVIYSGYPYYYKDRNEDRPHSSIQILTDRAIYRPNQTVYFKSIAYKTLKKESNVLANEVIEVKLNDVNGKEVAKISGKTNEFGSFSGSFQLPVSALTGNFQLFAYVKSGSYNGYKSIKVEEYKRPKFEVKVDEHKNVYQLDQKVNITGVAEAFSGAKIDQAVVKYRVYRQELFTYWPWYRSIPYGRSQMEEITFGETKTDSEGKYTFNFIAKPFEPKKDTDRLYNYTIEVSVTDINGETQTTTSNIKIGDKRLILSVELADKTHVDNLKEFKVNVTNVNDIKQNGKGKLELYQLDSPNFVYRKRDFKTDYSLYSNEEFRKLFPNEAFPGEAVPKEWKLGKKVFESDFDTAISNAIKFPNSSQLQEDYYIIKGYVMDGNEKVEIERIIYISNPEKLNAYTLVSVSTDKKEYKVGDKAKVSFNTKQKNGFVYYRINEINQNDTFGVLDLNRSNSITIPIKDSYLGNTSVSYYIVYNNEITTNNITLNVPLPSKDLKITTEVFRDKLQPGAKEKWTLKIEGTQKDKVSAEILASMYDASLDQFVKHSTQFYPNTNRVNYLRNAFGNMRSNFNLSFSQKLNNIYAYNYNNFNEVGYPLMFNLFDFGFENSNIYLEEAMMSSSPRATVKMARKDKAVSLQGNVAEVEMDSASAVNEEELNVVEDDKLNQIQARKVLNETGFFYPNLMTDADGNVIIEFTAPESLTEWKLMTLAHTKDLKVGYLENRVKTQKELMVVPNAPRFLREGDQVSISTKINNLSENTLNGTAKLMLFDAISMQPIEDKFGLTQASQNFTVAKGNSDQVTWTLNVPKNVDAVVYRVVAAAGDYTDGEESALPILTNRMLVTETMPVYIKENQTKTFNFDHLQNNQSKTLDHYKLTFEMTANPIWNAVFALPYLREYPYECAEQVFSRLYGNMVSEKILTSNPKIKAVFDNWNSKGELKSKLQLNEELKSIILEETPWLISAESEEEQMKKLGVLFQLNQMQNEMNSAFNKLSQKQLSSGGFAWFEGGRANEYITTHIVAGFGNLKKMEVNFDKMNINANNLIKNAIRFIDQENLKRFNEFKKDQRAFKNVTYSDGIHYLYARSFFLDQYPMGKDLEEMKTVMLKNLNDKKLDISLQQKAMTALVLKRFGMEPSAKQTISSVKERAVFSDEMGMYWKDNVTGWFWYDTPVETQAMLIEAFDEVLNDINSVEEMKIWLIKNKQTNQWNSTKATTKAVYALMNTGKSWIDSEKGLSVKIANQPFDLEKNAQAGSGYVKTTWNKEEIKPEMGKVEISKSSPGASWGAMYWQYFEDLDQIKSAETGIKFNKKLFIKQNTPNGPVLKEITAYTPIKVGDIVTVRLEISIDRNMEFVHIKDLRASGFEPVNVLSGYKWKGEFGYYESTRDASTNFFADYMRKGTYVFEYDLKANNAGNFSNGITSMQNMYAPELSAHSEGIRVNIQ